MRCFAFYFGITTACFCVYGAGSSSSSSSSTSAGSLLERLVWRATHLDRCDVINAARRTGARVVLPP